jgi:hypothetical protein
MKRECCKPRSPFHLGAVPRIQLRHLPGGMLQATAGSACAGFGAARFVFGRRSAGGEEARQTPCARGSSAIVSGLYGVFFIGAEDKRRLPVSRRRPALHRLSGAPGYVPRFPFGSGPAGGLVPIQADEIRRGGFAEKRAPGAVAGLGSEG